jgi:hypothetical protein
VFEKKKSNGCSTSDTEGVAEDASCRRKSSEATTNGVGSKWKYGFIKDHMARYNHLLSRDVKTTINLVRAGITDEDTWWRM